jgi:hypothetical protein
MPRLARWAMALLFFVPLAVVTPGVAFADDTIAEGDFPIQLVSTANPAVTFVCDVQLNAILAPPPLPRVFTMGFLGGLTCTDTMVAVSGRVAAYNSDGTLIGAGPGFTLFNTSSAVDTGSTQVVRGATYYLAFSFIGVVDGTWVAPGCSGNGTPTVECTFVSNSFSAGDRTPHHR